MQAARHDDDDDDDDMVNHLVFIIVPFFVLFMANQPLMAGNVCL